MKEVINKVLPPMTRYEAEAFGFGLCTMTFGYLMALFATRK